MIRLTAVWVIQLFIFTSFCFSQNKANLDVEVLFGIQKNDKRFWGQSAYQDQQKGWGTYHFGIRVNNHWRKDQKVSFKTGIGFSQELRTYRQPFDHCFDTPGEPCTEILMTLDNYQIYMVQTPIQLKYEFIEDFSLGFLVMPQFDYFKVVRANDIPFSDFKIGLYSIEFSPTVDMNMGKWMVSLGYRLFDLKRVDNVYLYGGNFTRENPDYLDQTFDDFNPNKWFLTLGFKL